MTDAPPSAIVGCLLDVSASMREALETDGPDERANDRLSAVLRAALKLAQSQNRHDSEALIFVGVFGLGTDKYTKKEYPKAIDLCEAADALLGHAADQRSGHELLVNRATEKGVPVIAKYIRKKFSDGEARIIDAYLTRHPDEVGEFMKALASSKILPTFQGVSSITKITWREGSNAVVSPLISPARPEYAGYIGNIVMEVNEVIDGMQALVDKVEEEVEDKYMEWSKPDALILARKFCSRWVDDFSNFKPRPVGEVIQLLARLQQHTHARRINKGVDDVNWLDTLRQYMYGQTPMQHALGLSLEIFKGHPGIKDRVLVVISDGFSTDGDPMPVARSLQQANVSIASIYLTSDAEAAQRYLHYQAADSWHHGRRLLFNMASRVAGVAHPIPALASMGWSIPSAGEVALHATVSTSAALNEICSLLLSARLGTANLLLDVAGRFKLDAYINDQNIRGQQNPSDQGHEPTCYAHAAAAVICMAMSRISGREGGYDDIGIVRQRILKEYTTGPSEQNAKDLFEDAARWYRLRLLEVDEDAARQAVLRRRPVLATFRLSSEGWDTFCDHFEQPEDGSTEPKPVLKRAQMMKHRSLPSDGGHAVVLVDCKPDRLTFLNSWGKDWGNNGSFSVEDHTVLELDGYAMRFYDVYWLLTDLTSGERQAHSSGIDAEVSQLAKQYPGIFDLKLRCPHCEADTPLIGFVSNADSIRRVQCVRCLQTFTPEPEYLRD